MRLLFLLFLVNCNIIYGQVKPDFKKALAEYFQNNKTDQLEGLYTVSDDITTIYPWYYFSSNKRNRIDHWAKVAIIRDSSSLTRDYFELVIQSTGFNEADIRGEFLRTKQNTNIFISEQLDSNKRVRTIMFEYFPDENRLSGTFKESEGDISLDYTRSYWKYYPK